MGGGELAAAVELLWNCCVWRPSVRGSLSVSSESWSLEIISNPSEEETLFFRSSSKHNVNKSLKASG
jgi:hypothetical protein